MTAQTTVRVTVRYFAAAAAAAGVETETLDLSSGTTVAQLVEHLGRDNAALARVLLRCSFLCDGIAVRDVSKVIATPQTVDVLPPFAGG